MKCDWIFLAKDYRKEESLEESFLPNIGDGKNYDNKGFEVVFVVTNRVSAPAPLIIAVEWKP